MRRFVIILLLISTQCYGQMISGPADSLKKILETAKEDTNTVWTLLRLVNATFTSSPDEADKYAERALQLSEKIDWKKGIAMSFKVKGGVAFVRSDFNRSLELSQQSLLNDPGENPMFRVGVMNNIANVYREFKQYDKLIPIYGENLILASAGKNNDEVLFAYYGLGSTHYLMKRYDSAAFYLENAARLAEKIGNKRTYSSSLCALSALKREQQEYQQSVTYAQQSLAIARPMDNKYVIAPALHNLSLAHFHLGRYREAKEEAFESLSVATELQNQEWEYEAWEVLYSIYEQERNIPQAFAAYRKFMTLKDSVLGNEKKQELARMEVRFEAAMKEATLNASHEAALQRQQLQRKIWIGAGIGLMLTCLLLFYFYKRRKDAKILQHEALLRAEIAETEMRALRLQMNPHFIFNCLNSISDYISRNEPGTANDFLVRFAKLMRLTLENSEQKEVSLQEDIKALETYLQLEVLRTDHKFTYSINIDPAIDMEHTYTPPLLLQPIVENSIWHGIAAMAQGGKIDIDVRKQDRELVYTISDNGVGMPPVAGQMGNRKSYGLKVTQARLDIINKTKKTNVAMRQVAVEKGTQTIVTVPFETNT